MPIIINILIYCMIFFDFVALQKFLIYTPYEIMKIMKLIKNTGNTLLSYMMQQPCLLYRVIFHQLEIKSKLQKSFNKEHANVL